MKNICLALLIISLFAAKPVLGQSQVLAFDQSSTAEFIYFGKDIKDIPDKLQALARNDELMEMGLRFNLLEAASQYAATARRELKISQSVMWALADSKGVCLVHGDDLPSAEAISQELQKHGIRSPIKTLREFLKKNPDHLDARVYLLSRFRQLAETRTIKALQILIKTASELAQQADPELMYRSLDNAMGGFTGNIDVSGFKDKKLRDKEDIEIWGAYAQELDNLFKTGDWRLFVVFDTISLTPLEACSPLMQTLYRRLISQVLLALRERPDAAWLWQTYLWMRDTAGDKESIRRVVDTLPPSSRGETYYNDRLLSVLIKEAREQNDWKYLADYLWKGRYVYIINQNRTQNQLQAIETKEFEGEMEKEMTKRMITGFSDVNIKNYIEPLLESLLRTSRVADAEYIVTNLARLPGFADFTKRAAALANTCDRPDLANKWLRLKIQTFQSKAEMFDGEYLEALFSSFSADRPLLVSINDDSAKVEGISAKLTELLRLVESGVLGMDWNVIAHDLDSEESELMLKRENWPGDEPPGWALIVNKKVILHGVGVPSENDIITTLELENVEKQTDKLRKLIKEYPNHVSAKEKLLEILAKIVSDKTKTVINKAQGNDANTELSSDDDLEIWGEYALLFRELIHFYSSNCQANFHFWSPMHDLKMSRYSPIMNMFAKDLLPIISSAIIKQPTDSAVWFLWVLLSDPTSVTQFNDMVERIIPSPFDNPRDIPDIIVRGHLTENYKLRENWRGILNVLEPFWESYMTGGEIDFDSAELELNRWRWSASTLPMIEAYLNLKKEAKLKEWLDLFKQSPRWKDVEPEVVKLFEKYGKDYS
ncbi:MAG: hypothetical protein LBQ86_08080 [Holophagales bacterium]|jgi:hypothetical protein|nr:hypothetical protein [Holophagales bacterium]